MEKPPLLKPNKRTFTLMAVLIGILVLASCKQRIPNVKIFPPRPVGTIVPPGVGKTIEGEGGTSVTIEPGSVPFEVAVNISPISHKDLVADQGNLVSVGAVELVFEPTAFNCFARLTKALRLSIPAPENLSEESVILVAQQMLTDALGDPKKDEQPSLKEQFVAVGTASVEKGRIVTQSGELLPGVFGGGLFNFLLLETGFATGIVSDATGSRPGVTVSNSTNTIVSVTNVAGVYTLPISGACPCPFMVTGFDPFRGSSGSAAGTVPTDGGTGAANIVLAPLATPAITRDGIRNGGFERGDLSSWAQTGGTAVRQSLVCAGATIAPTEGQWMADINTGTGSIGALGASLRQRFTVPSGVQFLRFDFNFVSEEFPEWVGSQYNDAFTAVVITPQGETTFAQTSVNTAQPVTLIGDCGFPGGDNTVGQTGWMEGNVDLSAFATVAAPVQVDIVFSAIDAGDNIYDSHVLIDNIRFSTVFIDAKFLQGPAIAANANLARVRTETLAANEILSQAGVNVQIRNTQTAGTTDALVDTDITWTTGSCAGAGFGGILTAEETAVLALAPSVTVTDIDVYFVRSFTGLPGVLAIAPGPDDFCGIVNLGTLQADAGAGGNILAHEFGHILITPQAARNVLEHGAAAGNFIRGGIPPIIGVLNRQQSASINGGPLLLP